VIYFALIRSTKREYERIARVIVHKPPPWRVFAAYDSYGLAEIHTSIIQIFDPSIETQIVAESSLDSETLKRYTLQGK